MKKQKSILKKCLATGLSAALIMTSVSIGSVTKGSAAAAFGLNYSKKTVTAGKTLKLTVAKMPSGCKIVFTKWTSSAVKVASVNKKGVVRAKKAGKTTIVCKVTYRKSKKKTQSKKLRCVVQVKSKALTKPSVKPTAVPSKAPTVIPSAKPTAVPSKAPTVTPSAKPTAVPSEAPTVTPSAKPTAVPSMQPTAAPDESLKHLSKNGIVTIDSGKMRDNIDAFDVVHEMGLGINLGNTMESCGTWINSSSVSNYEVAWGAPITTQKMITGMKKAGFHSIRIPVAWSNMMSSDGKYTINEAYFDRVETVMNYAFNAGMYVIVNIHYDSGWWSEFGSPDASVRAAAMEKYKAVWTQVANRYKEYSDYLIFESANEELGASLNTSSDTITSGYFTSEDEIYKQVANINQTFVDIVRGTGGNNASRFLLIAGYDTNITRTCDKRFVMPKDTIASHMFISVHYYEPATYCIADSPDNSWGYSDSWGTTSDIEEMKSSFNSMRLNYINKGIPVIIGEYGVTDGKKSDGTRYRKDGRDVFIYNVCKYALDHSMCPMLWDTNIIYSRSTCSIVNETEAANYKSLEEYAKSTAVARPAQTAKKQLQWQGNLEYSGWVPSKAVGSDSSDFTVGLDGGVCKISSIDWSQFKEPVLKMQAENMSGNAVCSLAKQVDNSNPYWVVMDEKYVLAKENWNFAGTMTIALKACGLKENESLYFSLSGIEAFSGKVTITISEKQNA